MNPYFDNLIESLSLTGNLRTFPTDGFAEEGIDFSSNDYLGYSRLTFREVAAGHPELLDARMTSSASRLLSSAQKEYSDLERVLENLYGHDRRALLFNSGYHANTGMISALAAIPGAAVFADKLVHASIIDGLKGVKDRWRFRHNDFSHLERLLQNSGNRFEHKIIVVESVYSMDGDSPDLETLLKIKDKYPGVILYVDEAHAFGVCGDKGLGLTMQTSMPGKFDIVVGTFGKALGSYGAFAVMSETMRNFFINRARSLIFSTSLPPQTVLWTRLMVEKMTGDNRLRARLAENGRILFDALNAIAPDPTRAPSHIAYFITGAPRRAVELSAALRQDGITVLPIRTPTVPPGTDRLRISLSAAHSAEDIEKLISSLKKCL